MSSTQIAQVLNPAPFTLSEATLVDAITTLAKIADEDVLEQVVESLDPRRDIPHILLSPLKELEAKSRNNLIALFVTHRFNELSDGTLQSLLKGRSFGQLMELWDLVIERKRESLAMRILSSIIQQKIVFSTSELGTNKVLNWLNGTTWDDSDQEIVNGAIKGSPDILYMLERAVLKDMISRVIAPDVRAAQAKSSTQPLTRTLSVESPRVSGSQVPQYSGNWPLVTLSALVMAAVYFAVPFDLPNNVSFVFRLATRLLELGYVYCSVVALAGLLIGLVLAIDDSDIGELGYWLIGVLIALAVAGACFAAQYFWFRLNYTFWGQVALIVLAGLIIAVPVEIWYASRRLVST